MRGTLATTSVRRVSRDSCVNAENLPHERGTRSSARTLTGRFRQRLTIAPEFQRVVRVGYGQVGEQQVLAVKL